MSEDREYFMLEDNLDRNNFFQSIWNNVNKISPNQSQSLYMCFLFCVEIKTYLNEGLVLRIHETTYLNPHKEGIGCEAGKNRLV